MTSQLLTVFEKLGWTQRSSQVGCTQSLRGASERVYWPGSTGQSSGISGSDMQAREISELPGNSNASQSNGDPQPQLPTKHAASPGEALLSHSLDTWRLAAGTLGTSVSSDHEHVQKRVPQAARLASCHLFRSLKYKSRHHFSAQHNVSLAGDKRYNTATQPRTAEGIYATFSQP